MSSLVLPLDVARGERGEHRGDWEGWLAEQRAEHERLTGEIVRLETELNDCVYRLYDLSPAEIEVIEKSTKYRYGEV